MQVGKGPKCRELRETPRCSSRVSLQLKTFSGFVCVPVDRLLVLADVMDPTEAAEEELALEAAIDVTDELLEPEQAAACGRSTPTLIIN